MATSLGRTSSRIHGWFIDDSRCDSNLDAKNKNLVWALGLVAIGAGFAAAGIYVGEIDDAPGAALLGILLALAMVALAARTARRQP